MADGGSMLHVAKAKKPVVVPGENEHEALRHEIIGRAVQAYGWAGATGNREGEAAAVAYVQAHFPEVTEELLQLLSRLDAIRAHLTTPGASDFDEAVASARLAVGRFYDFDIKKHPDAKLNGAIDHRVTWNVVQTLDRAKRYPHVARKVAAHQAGMFRAGRKQAIDRAPAKWARAIEAWEIGAWRRPRATAWASVVAQLLGLKPDLPTFRRAFLNYVRARERSAFR